MSRKAPQPRKRLRAPPSPLAFAYTLADAQALGAPGKTSLYAMLRDGRLKRADVAGCRTMITGDSLRALLGVKEEIAA